MKIIILDPALCCSTGVCGPDVDDALIETAANVKWLKSLGHDVQRHNISNDGAAFKKFPAAIEKIQKDGVDSLPYILVNEQIVMTGAYPSKAEWEALLALDDSENSPISPEEKASQKTAILICIGAAIAISNIKVLKEYVASAKKLDIPAQEIAKAMHLGNEVKNALSQEIIEQANTLLNEMQPKTSTCSPGSGCC